MLLSNLGNKLSYAIRRLLNDVPRLQVPRFSNDGSVLGGIMEGRAFATNEQITNQAMKEHAEELAKAKAEDEMMRRSLFGNGNKNNTSQYNIGEGISVGNLPTQLNQNIYGIDTSGWGTPTGNGISVGSFNPPKQNAWTTAFKGVKSFNQPSADNPLAQAVEGLGTNPNYMSIMSNGLMTPLQQQEFNEKMNLRQWLEWDAKMNGVTDPLISLARYNKFMPTMQKQAELEELRNAYYIMNSDPNDKRFTPEQRLNARTLVEFDKKNPYYVDDHDMNVEKFNWARQNFNNQLKLFPYKLRGALLGLDRQELALEDSRYNTALKNLLILGDYGSQNFEGSKWTRKDGVDLSNMQPLAIAGINHMADIYYQMTGEPILITSGKDSNVHVGGKFSHYNGYKVDVATDKLEKDPALRLAFINECAKHGIMIDDEYTHPSPGSTAGHLDLLFAGYRNNYAGKKNGKKPEMSYDDMVAIDKAKAAFTENPNAETSKPIAMAFGRYYRDLALAVGGELAKRQIYGELKKMFPDATPDMIELLTNGAVNAGVLGWINKTDGQATKTDSTPKPTEKNDPVNGLTYDDNYSGGYNIGGVRTSESMHNKIANIQPYEKTLQEQRENFEALRNAAENRLRYNEEEQSRLYDELEREFGI